MESFSLPSFAKVNLILRVLGKRGDGFHSLYTIFQTISLCDTLHFSSSESLSLTCDAAGIPTDGSNMIIRAAKMIRSRFGITAGADIHLEKRIPSPGGLGGGSSNAAVALIGLSRLWQVEAGGDDLLNMAAELGSDVPFFLSGGTAEGTGRGEVIRPLEYLQAANMLVVTPDVAVSTPAAFAALNAPTLTSGAAESILTVCRKDAAGLDLEHSVLINDFEESVFRSYPEIARVKRSLTDLGAVNAALSGSGASVFAIFDKAETRQAALKALDIESTWRKFAVSTISRSEYREALRCQVVSD